MRDLIAFILWAIATWLDQRNGRDTGGDVPR